MSEIDARRDYVSFAQFGINDRGTNIDTFKGYFVRFIDDAKAKGAFPVLVTSQNLKKLDANGKGVQTLGDFPDAMKAVAKDKNVPLIDLNEMSMRLYSAIGPGPDKLDKAFSDGTHHSDYGAYELANMRDAGRDRRQTSLGQIRHRRLKILSTPPSPIPSPIFTCGSATRNGIRHSTVLQQNIPRRHIGVMAGAAPRGGGAAGARGAAPPARGGRGAPPPATASQPAGR